MKYFLTVAAYYRKPGNQEERIYMDDKGELFIGPARDVIIGKTYVVEVNNKRLGESHFNITKFITG